jgi:hypothetical protein
MQEARILPWKEGADESSSHTREEAVMTEKQRLDPEDLDVDSLQVDELDQVAGGNTDQNMNCHSCTCPANAA